MSEHDIFAQSVEAVKAALADGEVDEADPAKLVARLLAENRVMKAAINMLSEKIARLEEQTDPFRMEPK